MIKKGIVFGSLAVVILLFISFQAVAEQKTYKNSIGMEFVLIPAGSFMMGADKNFEDCRDSETPRHKVTISKPFHIGKYEVTQEQWVAVMGSNPSEFKGRTRPVDQVSWEDAQSFIRKLNRKEGTNKYRLPTEAEWEYAARAGTTTAYSFGDDKGGLGQYVWYSGNSGKESHPVGQLRANAWGLYDIHGNVREWVQDWYGEVYYSNSPSANPKGPSSGSARVLRGGCWGCSARFCRSAYRGYYSPGLRVTGFGFRLVSFSRSAGLRLPFSDQAGEEKKGGW